MDLQEHQDSQLLVVVVSLEHRAFQEKEVKKESPAFQGCLCQVPLDVQDPQGPRVYKVHLDLQAFPQDKAALLESLDVLAYREREGIQERLARKVRNAGAIFALAKYPSSCKEFC